MVLEAAARRTSRAFLRQAVAKNSNNVMEHFALGKFLERQGMFPEASRSYEIALKLDSGNPRFREAVKRTARATE